MCDPSLGPRVDTSALGQRGDTFGAWELLSWFRSLSLVLLGLRAVLQGEQQEFPSGKDETVLRLS